MSTASERKPPSTPGEIADVRAAMAVGLQANGAYIRNEEDVKTATGLSRTRIEMALRADAAFYVRPVKRTRETGTDGFIVSDRTIAETYVYEGTPV